MIAADAEALVAAVADWASKREDIRALALVGSWARGNPRPTSDLDILLLSDLARNYQRGTWLDEMKFDKAGFRVRSSLSASYGAVWSAHVQLEPLPI